MPPSLIRWLDFAISSTSARREERREKPVRKTDEVVFEPPVPLTENYPFQYVREKDLNGLEVKLRPIRSDDDEMMIELFSSFSDDTIYHRFFTHVRMTPEKVKRFTHIDYVRQMAVVAVQRDGEGRRLLGVARYALVKSPERWGEMAVVVGDPWHGKGVGTALLDHLFYVAKNEGLKGLYGLVHYDNRAIPRVFEKITYPTRKDDTGTELRFEVLLDGSEPPGQ